MTFIHSPKSVTSTSGEAAAGASLPSGSWEAVLGRPARPVPLWVWVVMAAAVWIVAGQALNPIFTLVSLAGAGGVFGLIQVLRNPQRGIEFCLAVFPFYTFFRGVLMYFKVPAPLELLGMWTEVLLAIMCGSLILSCIRLKSRLRLAWYDGPILLMTGSVIYGLVLTLSERAWVAAMYGAHMSFFGMIFYFVTRWLPLTPAQVRRILVIWLGSFALLALVSLVDYVYRFDFVIEIAILIRDKFWRAIDPHQFFKWYPRMHSLLFAEQLFGSMCTFAAVYCLCRWHTTPRPRLLAPLLALMLVCLGLSMSRGALACFGAAMGTLLLLRGRHRGMTLLCFGLVAGAAGGLLMLENSVAQTIIERVVAVADPSNQLAYERASQWKGALEAFPMHPAGLGVGRAGISALFHGTGSETGVMVADGGIFKILAEQGLPGVILFLVGSFLFLVTFVPMRETLLRRAEAGDRWAAEGAPLGACVIALMVGLQAQNIGGNVFDAYYMQPVFWILVGLFVRCYEYSTVEQARLRETALQARLEALVQSSPRRLAPREQAAP